MHPSQSTARRVTNETRMLKGSVGALRPIKNDNLASTGIREICGKRAAKGQIHIADIRERISQRIGRLNQRGINYWQ